jgi:putative MATE family efflux protein
LSKLWKDIVESVKGSEQDYTTGNIGRAILMLSVPMVLEMVMESLFAIVDIFFVSRIGAEAIAAVGITESLMTLVYAVGIGLGMGTTGLVARRIGEKHIDAAGYAGAHSILLGIVASLFFTIPGVLFSADILRLMGASENVIQTGSRYTGIMFGTNGVIMLLFINNAIFRSAGDAAMAMRSLWLANGINILLDPCLIFGIGPFPEMGVEGAAVATSIGRGAGVLFQLYILLQGTKRIRLLYYHFKPRLTLVLKLSELSVGGIGQFLIATTSWIGLYWILGRFGDTVFAGYTIAIRLIGFSLLPAWGISNAAATLVGQNLGADKPVRAEKSVWITAMVNAIYLIAVGLAFFLFPDAFISLFGVEDPVILVGSKALKIISSGFLFYGIGMVMTQSFNGAGDTYTPSLLNFICFWLIEIPLAYCLAMLFNLGEEGVFYSVLIAESLMAMGAVYLFKQGKWKLKKV